VGLFLVPVWVSVWGFVPLPDFCHIAQERFSRSKVAKDKTKSARSLSF
jgi:hypothetical protein